MRGRTRLPGRPAYLALLPDFLFEADAVRTRYVLKTWLLVLAGSVILSALWQLLIPQTDGPEIPLGTPFDLFVVVIAAPILETILMTGPLLLLHRRFGGGPAVLVSAGIWGGLHSLSMVTWGLVAWWPFLLMGIAFVTWRPHGLFVAIALVSAIHALQNGFAVLVLLLVAQSSS